MISVVCGFIGNANPLQAWVMKTSHKMPGICSLLLVIFFAITQVHYLLKKLLMIGMKFPLRINRKFSMNVVYT